LLGALSFLVALAVDLLLDRVPQQANADDRAFDHVAERSEPTEGYHFGVNSLAQNVRFALYRDFPDPQRQRGAERF
jgi:hypothetical protein